MLYNPDFNVKKTDELMELYEKYYARWGDYPECYEGMGYSSDQYDDFVADIKKALELDKELPDVVDVDIEDDW